MTVAVAGDSVPGERARVRSAASPEGRAELRTRARRARRNSRPAAGGHLSDGVGEDEREVMVAVDLVGGAVPERGVQPAAVVELLDVLEDRTAGLFVGGERAPPEPLLLQRGEEALLGGVVVWAALAAVGLRDPVRAARGAERDRGVLPGLNRSSQHWLIRGIVGAKSDGFTWPHRDGLKSPHLAAV